MQLLAQKEGVQRRNLTELLKGRLSILAEAWELDLTKQPGGVQNDIHKRLMDDLGALKPPTRLPQSGIRLSPEQRAAQFRRVIRILFNAYESPPATGLANMLLMDRYKVLDSAGSRTNGVDDRINKDAARDDFDFVKVEIAKALARRLQSAAIARGTIVSSKNAVQSDQPRGASSYAAAESDIFATTDEGTEGPSAPRGEPEQAAPQRPRKSVFTGGLLGRRQRVVLACGAALVVVGGLVAAGELSGVIGKSASSAGPLSSASGKPPTVSSTTGPVMVTSTAYMRDTGTPGAWSYAFPQTLSSKDVASYGAVSHDEQQYQQWAFSKGGVTTDDDRLQIGLRGNESGTVVIQDIQVTKHCAAPLTGTLLYVPPQGESGDIGIFFDLDQQFPVAEDADTHASYFGASGAGHTITLNHDEAATLLLDAVTGKQYCTFSLTLDIATDSGSKVTEVVNDHGKPFQVTAAAGTGSSVPFSNYHAVYIQTDAESALMSVDPQTFTG